MARPPLPPFTEATAIQKVRMAEDAWNTRDPERVAAAYTEDSRWRNRAEFFQGRASIIEFLRRTWADRTTSPRELTRPRTFYWGNSVATLWQCQSSISPQSNRILAASRVAVPRGSPGFPLPRRFPR